MIEDLTLKKAVQLAVDHSRSYQSREESLFSQALSLSSSRHSFAPRLSSGASGDLTRGTDNRDSISSALDFGISKMLATGADISANITTSLFRYISGGDPAEAAASSITASIAQPLLAGSGRKIALENLTQAERSMVYAVRDFVRFRRNFSVSIAKQYYNLLFRVS